MCILLEEIWQRSNAHTVFFLSTVYLIDHPQYRYLARLFKIYQPNFPD